jgi:hypothetical protein
LSPQSESENGDGRVFKNKKGVNILAVFGTLNQHEDGNLMTLKEQFNSDIEILASAHSNILYKKMGDTFYYISGLKYGKKFCRKVVLKKSSFCFATLDYEQSEKSIYDSVAINIFKSFK